MHALCVACQKGHLETVKFLIENKADTGTLYITETLEIACQTGQLEVVKLLIENKANINRGDCLSKAIYYEHYEVVKLLLDKGADVNKGGLGYNSHKTPLQLAIGRDNIDLVKLLIKNGADVNKENLKYNSDKTPLQLAIERDNIDLVKLLIKNGANMDQLGMVDTPLEFACSKKKINAAKFLICQLLLNNLDEKKPGYIHNDKILSRDWDKIQSQVQALKDQIDQFGVSLSELITKDIDSLALSISNKKLAQLEKVDFKEKFPDYNDFWQERLSQLQKKLDTISSITSNPRSHQIFSSKNYQQPSNSISEKILNLIIESFNLIFEILTAKKHKNVKLNENCQREILGYLNIKDLESVHEAVSKPKQTSYFDLFNYFKRAKTNHKAQNQNHHSSSNDSSQTQTLVQAHPRF